MRILMVIVAGGLMGMGSAADGPGNDAFSKALVELSAKQYPVRQQALAVLRVLNSEQLGELGRKVDSESDGEVVIRMIEILERHYAVRDRHSPEVRTASEILEASAESPRWFVAEAARDVLKRHWRQRVSLAMDELGQMNANLDPRVPERLFKAQLRSDEFTFRNRSPTSESTLKIIIDGSWPSGPRALQLLQRLQPLIGSNFLRDPRNLAIILADGHPLTPEDVTLIRGLFGTTYLQERGKVSLGVSGDGQWDGTGVLVRSIAARSSAANAGIQEGDVILQIDGVEIRDFDDLVTRLRKYDVGARAMLLVQRGFSNLESQEPREIEVTLQAWGTPQDGPPADQPENQP